MLWMWTRGTRTVITVGDLNIWLGIVGIKGWRKERKEKTKERT